MTIMRDYSIHIIYAAIGFISLATPAKPGQWDHV